MLRFNAFFLIRVHVLFQHVAGLLSVLSAYTVRAFFRLGFFLICFAVLFFSASFCTVPLLSFECPFLWPSQYPTRSSSPPPPFFLLHCSAWLLSPLACSGLRLFKAFWGRSDDLIKEMKINKIG